MTSHASTHVYDLSPDDARVQSVAGEVTQSGAGHASVHVGGPTYGESVRLYFESPAAVVAWAFGIAAQARAIHVGAPDSGTRESILRWITEHTIVEDGEVVTGPGINLAYYADLYERSLRPDVLAAVEEAAMREADAETRADALADARDGFDPVPPASSELAPPGSDVAELAAAALDSLDRVEADAEALADEVTS